MTGPTHKQYSVTGALIASMLVYKFSLSEVNYYLALPIMLLMAKQGALFPDVDHDWRNVKDKTVPNWIINKLIHLTGGRHRSWQTHSIDIVVLASLITYYIPDMLLSKGTISVVNKEVLSIILMGFMSGWISHIISDMLTSAGVRVLCHSKRKIALVPKSIGNLRFNTGNEWEAFNFKAIRILNIALGVICLMYPFIQSGLINELINKI